MSISTTRRGLVLALVAAVVLLAQSASAATTRVVHTVLEDDTLSLFSPQGLAHYTSMLRWLGVDELRISAEWKLEAPDPNSTRAPRASTAATRANITRSG